MSRAWKKTQQGVVILMSSALAAAGCVEGVGVPCQTHAECAAGLVCELGTCKACADGAACVGVDLELQTCDADATVLGQIKAVRILIEENGSVRQSQVSPVSSGGLQIPSIPFGKNLRVRVEGIDRDANEPSAVVLARGQSALFDASAESPVQSLSVVLRPLESFHSTGNETKCSTLSTPRAGHTSTVLADGRVLIVGGYAVNTAGSSKSPLDSLEIYDPIRGTFTKVDGVKLANPRFGHTAALLPDGSGRVAIVGGWGQIQGQEQPLKLVEVFDPALNRFIPGTALKTPRARHATQVLPSGLLVVGGVTTSGILIGATETAEWIPLASKGVLGSAAKVAPSEGTVRPRLDGTLVEVSSADGTSTEVWSLGGCNAADSCDIREAVKEIDVFRLLGGTVLGPGAGAPPMLKAGRPSPQAALVEWDNRRGVIVGGEGVAATGVNFWEWVAVPGQGTPTFGPGEPKGDRRRNACSVLTSDGFLLVGGSWATGAPLATADLISPDTTGSIVSRTLSGMRMTRAGATCTVLRDGTVLIAGGRSDQSAVTNTAEIYQPR